ncbi:PHD finger protein 21A-like [Tubulanus polymorphus]|uniref:PHD finger protein 21A-like n=1 Tax=Tubulanus polymorphus TaxID=672921 RepID=UPI003DA38952
MSKSDLAQIQKQLKNTIQTHQTLVKSIKNDPQNSEMKKQLNDVQAQIQQLSEKQKKIVQQLRKDLATTTPATKPQSPKEKPKPPHTPTLPDVDPSSSTLNKHAPTFAPAPAQKPSPSKPTTVAVQKPQHKKHQRKQNPRPSSPLRVPNFRMNRPSILQGKSPRSVNATGRNAQKSAAAAAANKVTDNNTTSRTPPQRKQQLHQQQPHQNQQHQHQGKSGKSDFMAALELINHESVKDLQRKRSDRKRHANSGHLESEFIPLHRRSYGGSPLSKRPRGRYQRCLSPCTSPPSTPDHSPSKHTFDKNGLTDVQNGNHDNYCCICGSSGELLMCDSCSLVYHLQCLEPPLTAVPKGLWSCPKCQTAGVKLSTSHFNEQLSTVHAYIAKKAAKEEEKKKLLKRSVELNLEKQQLEQKLKHFDGTLEQQEREKTELMTVSSSHQQSVDNLKNFIRVFQTS